MTHDKIGRFLSLHISGFETTLRTCGCFGLFAFPCPYFPLYFSLLVSFLLSFRMVVLFFTSFWPCLISLKMFDIWQRGYSRCLSFFSKCSPMMRYVFDVLTFNGFFLYLPCQQRMAYSNDYLPSMTDTIADSLYSTITNFLCIQLASSFIQSFNVLICRSGKGRHKEPDSLRKRKAPQRPSSIMAT